MPACSRRAIIQEDIIQPHLRASLSWQTYRLGRGSLPSACNATYQALNVNMVQVPGLARSWNYTHDHSKWGVEIELADASGGSGGSTVGMSRRTPKWACIGDLNRDAPQAHRGGGYLCTLDARLHGALASLVAAVEPCGSSTT
jgi:deoxyribonuclease-2